MSLDNLLLPIKLCDAIVFFFVIRILNEID